MFPKSVSRAVSMSRELLCEWLDLPPTPWPPNHYALLGLPLGEGTIEEIERRVLERMETLRQHQLLYPEQVTEGMTLVAKALDCLTDPKLRRAFDRQLGLKSTEPLPEPVAAPLPKPIVAAAPPKEKPPPQEAPSEVFFADLPPDLAVPPRPLTTLTFKSETEVFPDQILIPELVEEEDEEEPLTIVADEAPETETEPVYELEEERSAAAAKPIEPLQDYRTPRRRLYAEIVRIRRVLRVWERLRIYLDEPEKTFERRTDTVAFMACLADLRPLLSTVADLIGGPSQHGNLIAALARQQLIVSMFRSLLPSQREALARDCQSAHYVLLEQSRFLRKMVRRRTKKNWARRVWWPLVREIVNRPEWVLLAVGVLALVIAFWRSVRDETIR